jgi:sporulation protein YlmC with PRC-barrel domain
MQTTMTMTPLVSLKSGQIDLADTNEHILGRKVVDQSGQDVGKVDDLFVDANERRARFIAVKSGDMLGLGGKTVLVPVDAITSAGDPVTINASRERILGGPQVDEASLAGGTGTTGVSRGGFDENATPLAISAYEWYSIDEPFWSPSYRRRNWA